MRKHKRPKKRADTPKPVGHRETRPTTGNKRLAAQARKILGKHYASKYRTR